MFFWKAWDVEFLGMFKFGIWASLKMLRAPIAVYKSVVRWHSNYSAVGIYMLGCKTLNHLHSTSRGWSGHEPHGRGLYTH